jgi:hypothetical protein
MAIATCNVVVPVFSTPTCRKMRSKGRHRHLRNEGRVIRPVHRRSLRKLGMSFPVSRRAWALRGLRRNFYAISDPVIPPKTLRTAISIVLSHTELGPRRLDQRPAQQLIKRPVICPVTSRYQGRFAGASGHAICCRTKPPRRGRARRTPQADPLGRRQAQLVRFPASGALVSAAHRRLCSPAGPRRGRGTKSTLRRHLSPHYWLWPALHLRAPSLGG